MQIHTIFRTCNSCEGDGIRSDVVGQPGLGTEVCPRCNGVGEYKIGHSEYTTDNIFPSYQILECLDATEHNALTDAQKDGVLAILACGQVDLNDGKAGRTRLLNWFGAESTTVANLTALLD